MALPAGRRLHVRRDPERESEKLKSRFRKISQRLDAASRRKALLRVSLRIGLVVGLTALLGYGVLSLYPWPASTTLRHLAASPNCDAARAVGLAPAKAGQPGYWLRHDRDADGIACEPFDRR